MTELEALRNFKIELNKLDRSSQIDVRPEKILYFLNKAALFLVKKKYRGPDPGPGRLELNHPVTDDLQVLVREVVKEPKDLDDYEYPAQYYEFSDTDHLYYLSSLLGVTPDDCNTEVRVEGRYVKPERVFKEMQSPFTESAADDPIVTISDVGLVVILGDFTLGNATIKYLAKPRLIEGASNPMELPFAQEIIDTAAGMALENFESQRIKTQSAFNTAQVSE